MTYRLVSASSADKLGERVTQWQRLGYELYGDPFFARLYSLELYPSGKDQFFQAMTGSDSHQKSEGRE